ncbi:MAG TPA: GNAT family N-acetyltransferase [Flavobacterium sp.]|jgi:hypothetical protein
MPVKLYSVRKYERKYFDIWNAFIATAKNATFLFHRDFMEYHSDRFRDCSMIIYENENPVALLPAHVEGNVVYSHNGLTYGGLVYGEKVKLAEIISIFSSVLKYLNSEGVMRMAIKTIPSIYHLKPAEEFHYALFLADAVLTRRDALSVIDLSKPYTVTKTRRESIRRGIKNELVIKEEPEFRLFWEKILIPNLAKKHGVKPVHSLEEIEKLHRSFPENIRHFNVYHQEQIVAGTTVFVSENVAHPQYISGREDKNTLGSLDFLYHHLLTEVFTQKRFFDFGISNEQQGRKLNEGLVFWKESLGANTVVQDFYEVDTINFASLEKVLI